MKRCAACGQKTSASGSFCRTCRSKRFHARKRIEREGLIVDQAGGSWWVWDRKGEVLVMGKPTKDEAINALALGDETDDLEDDEENPTDPLFGDLSPLETVGVLVFGGGVLVGLTLLLVKAVSTPPAPTLAPGVTPTP